MVVPASRGSAEAVGSDIGSVGGGSSTAQMPPLPFCLHTKQVGQCLPRPGTAPPPRRCHSLDPAAAAAQGEDVLCQLCLQIVCYALALGAGQAVHDATL